MTPALSRAAACRIACAVVTAETERLREAPVPPGDWPEPTPLGADGLGLDSLERLGALAALAELFDLDDAAPDDEPPATVGAWIDRIMRRQADDPARLVVRTSGSTGTARPCAHVMADLLAEAAFLAAHLGARRRVVALVPAHHLYGIVWTALLPDALGVPVVARAIGGPLDLAAGDLVVAVPEQWRALLRLIRRFPADVAGVSSGGPLDEATAAGLLGAGIGRLIDVYGASETGAIALRDVPADAYDLLPRWRLVADGEDGWRLAGPDGAPVPLPDHVERIGARRLRPAGRRDGAVQVGGHNVWPARVARLLAEVAGVAEATVRLGADGRLKAFVVPAGDADPATLRIRLDAVADARLTPPERPRGYRFGPALPRNAMGKLRDWG